MWAQHSYQPVVVRRPFPRLLRGFRTGPVGACIVMVVFEEKALITSVDGCRVTGSRRGRRAREAWMESVLRRRRQWGRASLSSTAPEFLFAPCTSSASDVHRFAQSTAGPSSRRGLDVHMATMAWLPAQVRLQLANVVGFGVES